MTTEEAVRLTLLLGEIEEVATKYWEAGDCQMQARALAYALKVTGLCAHPKVYDCPEFLALHITEAVGYPDGPDGEVTDNIVDLLPNSSEYWAVLIPKPDSNMVTVTTMTDTVTGRAARPLYMIGYHRADDTVSDVCEVGSIKAVIDTVQQGPIP